ncbi:hypothetical protein HAX54_025872 [Datura stramonium]|uniref:Uncharacterized protein n=1 Tax=Datura stramonium TaxID=4076 RepID=A0ABS8V1G5_DATST|nr:hypothetical protein [Datura stramonium]
MLKDRSSAELAMGNLAEALEDAKEALTIAPNYLSSDYGQELLSQIRHEGRVERKADMTMNSQHQNQLISPP